MNPSLREELAVRAQSHSAQYPNNKVEINHKIDLHLEKAELN